MAKYNNINLAELTQLASALSDASRVRAFMALTQGELCVCQIVELLGLAPSTVSKHMAVLCQAGFVQSRKQGRWVYYSVSSNLSTATVCQMQNWLANTLKNDGTVKEDRKRLRAIKKMDTEQLCKNQRKG